MILFNEQFIKDSKSIEIEDRGYQFGDGVYEVIRVYNGQCFALDQHIERLLSSSQKIRLPLPYSISSIKKNLIELIRKENLQNGTIYLQISRGVAPRTHHFPEKISPVLIAYVKELARPIKKIQHGINAILSEDIRWSRCDIKSLNLLGNILSKQKAKDNDCEEAILYRDKIITEGSSTNVFMVKDSKIYTHPANNFILKGITRQKVFNTAVEKSLNISEETFTISELLTADEVFVTSTTLEIVPVIKVNDSIIGKGYPGKITNKLQDVFEREIDNCS